ncbi:MAG: asparagine synthase (glutamine-hydrolyzing) [Flavobacteriales bacterium]|nr:asparagine synthase (glutamine-hydrolyzing) [Flavobacteriales bacterium]
MCGIVGIVGSKSEKVDLSKSLFELSKRGPDRQASLRSGRSLLGHTRLSIIDTTHLGDQPMQDPTGRYTLVFNGEIYNYRTIAESLSKKGLEFKSNSDTEVLLHLLIEKGISALDEVNGFFAFAFYDSLNDYLLLARDRIGIKPLYYCIQDDSISFSSELKGLSPLVSKMTIDTDSLHLYFRFNYLPVSQSIFQEIEQLRPGHFLEYKSGDSTVKCYYKIEGQALGDNLYDLLSDAVRLRLVSDVALGSFLSGGVDSSIIAALANIHSPGLKTFSIGFKDNSHFDESTYAEKVANHIGSDHKTIQLYQDEMLQHVSELLNYTDEPFADSSAIAVHALSQHTRKDVTVALSGDGADELFGGYNKHQAHLSALYPGPREKIASIVGRLSQGIKGGHNSRLSNLIRQVQRFSRGKDQDYFERYWTWSSWTAEEKVSSLLSPEQGMAYEKSLRDLGPRNESLEEVLLSDTRCVLPSDMLTKVDRMSMANSLEVRVPFLDHRVVEFAHSKRADQRFRKGRGKFILRDNFAHILPQEVFDRKKKGFEVPLESWFLGPLNKDLKATLNDGLLVSSGFFSAAEVAGLSDKLNRKKISDVVHLLWAIMVFHRFYSRFGH